MTPEQLMQPRYKVIADYPGNKLEVRSILDQGIRDCFNCDGIIYHESILKKYPHIFKPLQWWEERTIEDMPQYAKVMSHLTDGSNPGDIVKIDTVEKDAHWKFLLNDAPVMYFIPVTESEYTTYINSKK